MHGLAVFEHNIVGDVNDIIDRTDAQGAQALAHPAGRGLDTDIFDNPGGVDGAEIGFLYLNVQHMGTIAVSSLYHRSVQRQRLLEGSRGLARKANNREAVRPVGGNLKFNDSVI